ncbi:hypothetical protein R4P64_30445 [Rhodococcus sp. IEGM 1366]|uniref:hypothetical protein n=1 Tax=Rhodococcus sp. IEGM 1366 TaxID=3082223 RepID=UPI0029551432|nr:hypothetical protein [Rhodococcus sp. IEGM 1366]MDV8070847.1 hypothetical protein [Rhodococcus sp. IEGM 1366]
MAPGSDYLPGAVNPNLTQNRAHIHTPGIRRPDRTLEITMNSPFWNTTEQDPFTEQDLTRIAQEYADDETILCGMDPDEARSFWELEDGYLVYAPDPHVATIRIGRGRINGQTSRWVDQHSSLGPRARTTELRLGIRGELPRHLHR